MKFYSIVCAAILCIGLTWNAFAQDRIELRVMTYNIHHGEGIDGKLDLERIAAVINSVAPDFVALQEVDNQTERTNKVDQVKVLSELTGLHYAYGKALDFQGGAYGNAFLSRYPIEQSKVHILPKSADREQRVFLQSNVKIANEKMITFIATHLDNSSAVDRMAAVEMMDTLLPGMTNPILFAGDMNAVPESAEMTTLMKTFTPAIMNAPLLTSPAENPRRQIDYIFYYPSSRWQTKKVEVLDEAVASDHRALMAVIELLIKN